MTAATHQLQDFTFHVARFDQFRIRQTSQCLPQLNVFFSGLKCYNALTGSRDEFARIEREGLQFRKVGFGSVDTCLGQNNRIKFSRSEEHTSELQSRENLVCRLLLEKKNDKV